jgi:AcrR family transcriptional regulator
MDTNISKKQNIINTAADLFREKGYAATSIRNLAAAVGLEPSSIYSHIRSKEDLLTEICTFCADRFSSGMNEIYFLDISEKKKLKHLIKLHLDIAYENPASITVFNDDWKFLPEQSMTSFIQERKEYEKKFKKILLDGKKHGKFEFDNIDILFSIIIKMLNWSYTGIKSHPREALEIELTQFILKSLNK